MSTIWRLGCRTCNVVSDLFELNHGEHRLAELIESAATIRAVSADGLPELLLDGAGEMLAAGDFLRSHEGHDLRPKNEYGHWLGDCCKRHDCGECDRSWHCRLPEKHEGKCSPKKEPQ